VSEPAAQAGSIVVIAAPADGQDRILTDDALAFLAELHTEFDATRHSLLTQRQNRRDAVAAGTPPHFSTDTADIREGDWRVAPIPADLRNRRVEITGPTDRKMTINALNSGAQVWLADLEDANTPHWENVIGGQVSLADAVRGSITLESDGKSYALNDGPHPTIVMRPRGWHLDEKHLVCNGEPTSGSLTDFGLYAFHNAAELVARGKTPAFYLPKMESHLEARLWADVFAFTEQRLGIAAGTIRATVLIETIWAAFEMDEILYELRDYIAGLNAGRWDYLFSIIKTFRDSGDAFVLPDRAALTMTVPFMKAYSDLLVATCHRRGAYAIGGMAAFIPSRDPAANELAFDKVRADKTREANAGYEGSWVAHPGLVSICREIFDAALGDAENQLGVGLGAEVTGEQLIDLSGTGAGATADGLRANIEIGLEYLVTWLSGRGAVAIHNLMEDAATAEISRSQVWQWRQAGTVLDTGQPVTAEAIVQLADVGAAALEPAWAEVEGGADLLARARTLLVELMVDEQYEDFLTTRAYELIP
jgi:malate synthase